MYLYICTFCVVLILNSILVLNKYNIHLTAIKYICSLLVKGNIIINLNVNSLNAAKQRPVHLYKK